MTTAKSSSIRIASAFEPVGRIARAALGAVLFMWTVGENRRKVKALNDLDDYLLADMGLSRADLRAAAGLPLHRDPSSHLAAVIASHEPVATASRIRGRRGDGHAPIGVLGRTP